MNKNIPIKNIFYMLTYVFENLNQTCYQSVQLEHFDNATDMFAAILIKGVEQQLKRYLNREYVQEKDSLSTLKGKIQINDSINEMSFLKKKLVCSYDEFSIDSYMNQILKSCIVVLIKSESVRIENRQKLKGLLPYFNSVHQIDLHRINWNFHYNKNNQSYRLLMGICNLLVTSQLQSRNQGKSKIMDFYDDQESVMHNLYERFIYAYYQKEYKNKLSVLYQKKIDWQVTDGFREMLPNMFSDIMLQTKDKIKTLIIDAKYYSQTTQMNMYGNHTVHSNNLYQIFTYVKNKEEEYSNNENAKVSGMLLYAMTFENQLKNNDYQMSGNMISVRTLNLNCDFEEIRKQLNYIPDFYILNCSY